MISTVTTTVTTVTTTALASSLALLATLTLLTLLIKKEVISVSPGARWQRLSHALNVAILPLLLTFIVITAVEVMSVL